MNIILIGAGRLATQLGTSLISSGHTILQIYSPTKTSASQLADKINAPYTTCLQSIDRNADLYIIAIKDNALYEILKGLPIPVNPYSCVVHTAGSVPLSLFNMGKFTHYGIFYPLQTFSKERNVDFSQIPCFIEASDTQCATALQLLCLSLGATYYELNSERRKWLHLAAVFACNFTNHCYSISEFIMKSAGIPFHWLLPLIDETAAKVHERLPSEVQTGPAIRYDTSILTKQEALLSELDPELVTIYDQISKSIHRMSGTTK